MKTFISFLLAVSSIAAQAQKDSFDLLTYTPPKGWKKTEKPAVVSYAMANTTDGSWCQIAIYQSTASKGMMEADFTSEWNTLVVKPYQATVIQSDPAKEADGWKIQTGAGKFAFNKGSAMALLTCFSGFYKCISVVITMNNRSYQPELSTFMSGIYLKKPVVEKANTNQNNTTGSWQQTNSTATFDGYKFNTTSFDDGWTSTLQPSWVEVKKGDTKALIHFLSSISNNYESNRMVSYKVAWDHLLCPVIPTLPTTNICRIIPAISRCI